MNMTHEEQGLTVSAIQWANRWSAQLSRGELAELSRAERREHLGAYLLAAAMAGAEGWDEYALAVADGIDAEDEADGPGQIPPPRLPDLRR